MIIYQCRFTDGNKCTTWWEMLKVQEALGGGQGDAGSVWEIFVLSTQHLPLFDPHSPVSHMVQDHHLPVLVTWF